MSGLESIEDANWMEFTSSPMAVLLVTESDCTHCKAWKAELAEYLEEHSGPHGCRFGAVTLDGEGVDEFKKANEDWLDLIDGVPFNVLYFKGEPKNSFYGGGMKRLLNRLNRLGEE